MTRSVRCLVGWHRWQRVHDEEGELRWVCRRCGKVGDGPGEPIWS